MSNLLVTGLACCLKRSQHLAVRHYGKAATCKRAFVFTFTPLMSATYTISLRANQLHIHQYGNGKRVLILFHGFGESGALYDTLGRLLGKDYTVVVPDLPFHGETRWGNDLLSADDLVDLTRRILQKEAVKSCSVMGYSLGGRLALCLLQQAPLLIDRFLLAAPEGLRKNPWFHLATGTRVGQWVFKKIIFNPQAFVLLIKLGRRAGWVNKTAATYLQELITDPSSGKRVYRCWRCFRTLKPGHEPFKNSIPLHFYFGKYDRLIPPPNEKEIQMWSPAGISVFSTGHLLFLHESMLKEIHTYLCTPGKT